MKMAIYKDAYEAMVQGNAQKFERLLHQYPKELLAEPTGRILMHGAATRGQLACVEVLVKSGIDVNIADVEEPGGTLIHAAGEGHLEVTRWLLDNGARINYVKDGTLWCSALNLAIAGGHLEVVRLLVERGADVNAVGPGLTPLAYAIAYNRTEIAAYLSLLGAKTAEELGVSS